MNPESAPSAPPFVAADTFGTPPQPQEWPLRFVGSGSEYFRIWIVNLLLILATLGLYYPFAKVRRMKYFHGATELAGQPFGYHADPWAMLRGYLLVGVLVGLYSVAGHFSPIAGLLAFVIVASIWPALWHSSLHFRFANTSWRGLRFHFRGTRGEAYKTLALPIAAALLFSGLVVLIGTATERGDQPLSASAGIGFFVVMLALLCAFPWGIWLMHRYRQHHLGLGREESAYTARVRSFYGLTMKTSLVSVVPFLLLGVVVAVLIPGMRAAGNQEGMWILLPLVMVFYIVLFSTASGYYTARLQDLMWNGTVSSHLGFKSALKARSLIGLWVKNWLLIGLTLGLYFPFAQIASARLRLEAVTVKSSLPADQLTARLQQGSESPAGDAAGDMLGLDIGL